MSIALQLSIVRDTASPALKQLEGKVTPRRIGAAIGPAVKNLITANYLTLGKNKQGFPSTGFWANATRATRLELQPDGPLVITDWQGVRQRYFGGTIRAGQGTSSATGQPTKYITIAAIGEAYGKTAGMISDLKFVRFGRGADAPAALVRVSENKSGEKPSDKQVTMTVFYWLKREVTQPANPDVLPSEAELNAAIDKSLNALIPS